MGKLNEKDTLVNKLLSMKKAYSMPSSIDVREGKGKNRLDGFGGFDQLKELNVGLRSCEKFDIESPYFRSYSGRGGVHISFDKEEYLNFASYDYLNLNGHPETAEAIMAATKQYGSSVSGSRIVSGERPIHKQLESKLADLYQTESALLFVSGSCGQRFRYFHTIQTKRFYSLR